MIKVPPLLRPVREDDLDALCQLAAGTPNPIVSLPPDRGYIRRRICDSLSSFSSLAEESNSKRTSREPCFSPDSPGSYFFVLEAPEIGALLGTSAASSRVGRHDSFRSLGIENGIRQLRPAHTHEDSSEISTLYLAPCARKIGFGRLLSLSRFLFAALFPSGFAKSFLAGLRGTASTNGHATSRNASGEIHPKALPALRILKQQGFRFTGEIDLLDSGPIYKARAKDIPALRNTRQASFSSADVPDAPAPDAIPAILATGNPDFLATLAPVRILPGDAIATTRAAAGLLSLMPGDKVCYLPAP